MNKKITATFSLDSDEVREAIYDAFVRKLKALNINASFEPKEISIEITEGFSEVELTIYEEINYEI